MSKTEIQAGSTSITRNIFIRNATTGLGLTGLVYNSTGLTAYYVLNQAASVSIALATQTVSGAWSTGGFVEIDSTHFPGLYRLDIPNAVLASGSYVDIMLRGAANMIDCPMEIELTAVNNQDGVRYGMTALPNTAVTTNASLLTSGTGTDQISVSSGKITVGTISSTASNIKKNTALANFPLVMTDSTLHQPLTGATVTSQVLIDGGSFGSTTNSVTEVANGVYIINLAAADLNGTNITLRFTATGADPRIITLVTQP